MGVRDKGPGSVPTDADTAAAIVHLRVGLGLTQTELARRAGISRVALGKIEQGEVAPQWSSIEALADALGVTVANLFVPPPALRQVRFRADKAIQEREPILVTVADWLDGYACLEEQLGPRARPPAPPRLKSRSRDPVRCATQARRDLGMGDEPIRDICGLLEAHGVKVLRLSRATDSFFGLSVGPDDGGPAVVVNTWNRISVERWIFSAAHELGHLLLHLTRGSFEKNGSEEIPEEERDADVFASHFLMPEPSFERAWTDAAGLSLLDRVIKVKRIFRVSYKTVLTRLVASGRTAPVVWREFQRQHRERYGKTLRRVDEPKGMTEAQFGWNRADEPERLSAVGFSDDRQQRLVRLALEEGVISMGKAAELLRLTREDMRKLTRTWFV